MKKNRFTILLVLALITIALTSCDDLLGGGNIAGADDKLVSVAVDTVTKVDEKDKADSEKTTEKLSVIYSSSDKEEKTEVDVDAKKFTSNGKELVTVGTAEVGSEKKNVLSLGGNSIEIPKKKDSNVDFSKIKEVLPPKEIGTTTTALEGEAKAKTLEELKKPVDDDLTKEAAKGSAMIIQSVLEASLPDNDKDLGEEEEIVKKFDDISKKLDKVTSGSEELTKGDVVVLQAISNVVYSSTDGLLDVIELAKSQSKKDSISEEESKKLEDKATKLLDKVYDQAINLASIVDKVSSGEASPVFEGLNFTQLLQDLQNEAKNGGN